MHHFVKNGAVVFLGRGIEPFLCHGNGVAKRSIERRADVVLSLQSRFLEELCDKVLDRRDIRIFLLRILLSVKSDSLKKIKFLIFDIRWYIFPNQSW